eukprot:2448355-Amphidinium_carterae.1
MGFVVCCTAPLSTHGSLSCSAVRSVCKLSLQMVVLLKAESTLQTDRPGQHTSDQPQNDGMPISSRDLEAWVVVAMLEAISSRPVSSAHSK